jgi:hypothetical protein
LFYFLFPCLYLDFCPMTQLGTPTAETWNKQVISATGWGTPLQPPSQPANPQKLVEQNLTSHHPRGYLVAEASSESSPIPARKATANFRCQINI